MNSRCTNKKTRAFKFYGGRGIRVCERWGDFANFLLDMGGPGPGQTLDRIDNDLGYEPGNCRWADQETQSNNRRTCIYVEVGAERLTVVQWARKNGLKPSTVYRRIADGWSHIEAVTTPSRPRNFHT